MATSAQRFYIRSPDGRMIVGFDDLNAAGAVALDYGEGAHLVDTIAQACHPIAQEVSDGELVYVQIGGWGAGKFSVERNLVESIKKGHVAIVHAFLAKGADPNTKDDKGAPARNDVSLKPLPWIARHESSQIILSGRPSTGHDGSLSIQ